MVYNYFTPTTKEEEDAQKDYIASGQHEFDILTDQLDEYNSKIKGDDHSSMTLEDQQVIVPILDFYKSKGINPSEAIQLIATFIKENMGSKKSTICLNYLITVYREVQSSHDFEQRNRVQLTIYEALQKLI